MSNPKKGESSMTQTHSNISLHHNHYQHLSLADRGKIEVLHKQGYSIRKIASIINRNPSTVSRELKRGTTVQMDTYHKRYTTYFAETGQAIYEQHRRHSHARSALETCLVFFSKLSKALKHKPRIYSVDTFVMFFQENFPTLNCPSTPTVYRYIEAGVLSIKNGDLPRKVQRRFRRPNQHHNRMNKTKLGTSIEKRPTEILTRDVFGHWEGDLVKGKRVASEPAMLTLTERMTRYEIIVKIPNYHAITCKHALKSLIQVLGKPLFKSITFDNGAEFSKLNEIPGLDLYFAHPYSPWERGSNENQNGLIREFIPKGRSLHDYSQSDMTKIQETLNHRPRKSLAYQTAETIFNQQLALLN